MFYIKQGGCVDFFFYPLSLSFSESNIRTLPPFQSPCLCFSSPPPYTHPLTVSLYHYLHFSSYQAFLASEPTTPLGDKLVSKMEVLPTSKSRYIVYGATDNWKTYMELILDSQISAQQEDNHLKCSTLLGSRVLLKQVLGLYVQMLDIMLYTLVTFMMEKVIQIDQLKFISNTVMHLFKICNSSNLYVFGLCEEDCEGKNMQILHRNDPDDPTIRVLYSINLHFDYTLDKACIHWIHTMEIL